MPFDLRRLAVTGPARRSIESVMADGARGSANFALSATGTMAYSQGRNIFEARSMAWIDRSGRAGGAARRTGRVAEPGVVARRPAHRHGHPGRRAARHLGLRVGAGRDDSRDEGADERRVPDVDAGRCGARLPVFTSSANPRGSRLAWKRADGNGGTQVLVPAPGLLRPGSWHPTKPLLAYVAARPGREDDDVMILPIASDGARGWEPGPPTAIANRAARERAAKLLAGWPLAGLWIERGGV